MLQRGIHIATFTYARCSRCRSFRKLDFEWYVLSARGTSASASNFEELNLIPLNERKAVYSVQRDLVTEWHAQMQCVTKSAIERRPQPDDADEKYLLDMHSFLQKELGWLLEDAVAGDSRGGSGDDFNLKLRLPLKDLSNLWLKRLYDRVPLQYLVNAAYWREFVLAVGPGVLIPRPETECLIDFVIQERKLERIPCGGIWADLGTGSGALAIGIASALPDVEEVWATDESPSACAWAALNCRRLGFSDRIKVMGGDFFGPLDGLQGRIAGILSNPPYIQRHVLSSLQAEVAEHEPALALDGGEGAGLDCLRRICSQAAAYLEPGGFLGLETGGPKQAEAVATLLATHSFDAIQMRQDQYGVVRFVTARRKT